MKKLFKLMLLVTITISQNVMSNPLSESDILGIWINQAGDGYIEISEHNHIYTGTIIGSADGKDRQDLQNPDSNLRQRSLLNVTVLDNFKYTGDNQWKEGWVYDPNNGKTYSCKMRLIDKQTLDIRGYIGISLFGRTETWKKAAPLP